MVPDLKKQSRTCFRSSSWVIEASDVKISKFQSQSRSQTKNLTSCPVLPCYIIKLCDNVWSIYIYYTIYYTTSHQPHQPALQSALMMSWTAPTNLHSEMVGSSCCVGVMRNSSDLAALADAGKNRKNKIALLLLWGNCWLMWKSTENHVFQIAHYITRISSPFGSFCQ